MQLKKQIPNIITLLNLFCGCIATIFAVQGALELAALFVVLGIGFDFFDGFAARILNVQSELGLQLDSLADMVTSGLVPGIVMFQMLAKTSGTSVNTVFNSWDFNQNSTQVFIPYLSLIGLLVTLASAYRLAKFNIDTRQTTSFIGLPTPANALLILSLPLILQFQTEAWISDIILNQWFLIGLTLVSCYLLNAEIPLFALKFKTWGLAENKMRYIFLLLTILLLIIFKFLAIPCVILLYVIMSMVFKEKTVGE
ncbi:phosphatidylserine synthase [Aquimarina sp. BL5]|uniref:CDP-alcohol phosphatidyltransferase family protein n=1 Tax=Aquimarina sp. BL5 TaxID=1714860 RepID=UPI000E4B7C56|nr:CDP-alcohol phosphatidyltransferase family protein [Aquimarina sp. BL5]AXT50806.1 phosphatidylserine synthase [Aquimarina sp. BL5]RKN05855.1 phosphatidylserine synthase [Aquimarina sp. BL5]